MSAPVIVTKYAFTDSLLPTLTPKRQPTAVAPNAPVKANGSSAAKSPVSLPPVTGVAANLDAKFAATATVPSLSGTKRPRTESDVDSP